MTTVPSIATVSNARRMASTAAPSASFFCPRPIQREAASAAASGRDRHPVAVLREVEREEMEARPDLEPAVDQRKARARRERVRDDLAVTLRAQFADETDETKRKALALAMQERVAENPTHIFLGQWYQPAALRKTITGNMESPVTVFWNIEKK